MNKHLPSAIAAAFLSAALLTTGTAQADYQDPIDLPAINHPAAPQSLQLDITRVGDRLVSVGERGYILYSDDNGNNWQQAQVPTRAHLNAVTFVDEQYGWAVGEDQVILATTDGGQSWDRQFDNRDAEFKGPLLDVTFTDRNNGMAIGVYNKVFVTSDGGQSWSRDLERVDNLDEWHLFEIADIDKQSFYIASEMGLLFVSTDGGNSFTQLQTDHDGSFHGLLVRKGDDGQDQIAAFGVGGILYTSTDSGQSWSLIETGTKAGLAGGIWLEDGSAVIVGADGSQVKLSADLNQAQLHYRDDGLPMNAVAQSSDGQLLQSGLFGIIPSPTP